MTILSFDSTSISSELNLLCSPNGKDSPNSVSQIWSIPRINLRKRPFVRKASNLESVNSAFLSSLFAEVANATEDASTDTSPIQSKKVRHDHPKSMARCGQSFACLTHAVCEAHEKDPSCESYANSNTAKTLDPLVNSCSLQMNGKSSLGEQSDCLTSLSSAPLNSADISSAGSVAFPSLPATVSNGSYGTNVNTKSNQHPVSSSILTLTHVTSDLQSSDDEKSSHTLTNDTYGWFVEMEDESTPSCISPVPFHNTALPLMDPYLAPIDLAFSAQVAPKADNFDAELEWATAADTVDDVLGCFF
jgi:hypothetical protein